ncbi:MAG: GNAT family N-acetyltransferase [Chloroflexota bacterium]|nr:GNAT family N-acetyltransferase [Chloroflexota bacterium]
MAGGDMGEMLVEPLTLVGRTVRLEPLGLQHAEGLWKVSTPELFTYMWTWSDTGSLEAFRENIRRLVSRPDWRSFAIVMGESGEVAGTTSYLDIRSAHRGLEIGSTWIGKAYQGTHVNPENKYLLLRHAFETLGAVRVQLKTDGRNVQSQRAMAKLGAKYEGVLRKHMVLPDGYVRDTVMYSVIDEEWPALKARLEARLGYAP